MTAQVNNWVLLVNLYSPTKLFYFHFTEMGGEDFTKRAKLFQYAYCIVLNVPDPTNMYQTLVMMK